MSNEQDYHEFFNQKPIAVVQEEDKDQQHYCMQKGYAMLIIPESATAAELNQLLSNYENFPLWFFESSSFKYRVLIRHLRIGD